jgi:hypothetical protein
MKNLLTISQEDFRAAICKLSVGELKRLLENLFVFIKNNAHKYEKAPEVIYDLERKQTKLWAELQRRGELNPGTNVEFMNWLYKKHQKRVW